MRSTAKFERSSTSSRRWLIAQSRGGTKGDHEAVGQAERDPRQWEEFTGNLSDRVFDPEQSAGTLRSELRQAIPDALRDLVLIDKRTGTAVSHRDVGIGVSQVLPVLVSAYAFRDQLVAIEQPEVHAFARRRTASFPTAFRTDNEIERKRMEVLLERLSEAMVRRPNARWNPGAAWLDNAEDEHGRVPFHAILARDNTDLGGVTFGAGRDEGDPTASDDIQLLDREQYEERWRQYASEAPAFDRPEPRVRIEGVG